jgi:hypothetical protein
LEISSFNAADAKWREYDFSDWFMDQTPVPALVEGAPQNGSALAPRWVGARDQ